MTLRILLADDHAMFRSGLKAVLSTQDDLCCVAEVADGQAAVDETGRLAPDVAILDVRMPRLDGLRAAERILGRPGNTTKVIVLTTYDDDSYVYRALHMGASGFLLKSAPPEETIAAIRIAARGDAIIDPSVTRRLISRFAGSIAPPASSTALERLTAREHEVLMLVAQAHSNTEIAQRLGIGDETVKTHVSRILAKLGLRDRTQAVMYAASHRLVAPLPAPPAGTERLGRRMGRGGSQN
ncbi:response regulator transcription factor [Streptomyces sp. NEAU-YJ-81]|uniref:response regulator n=1 Tax=Streptomyces sp. NEAU-YJ-81 TaxID=2820288 RepID=UPI001ABCA2E2|nr:response regulator transcription factor [Streptomyces sp. NEAU-YJ-81]MBO3676248.1 response regulator transcription factor [Streptomyces sp. NEAU-YJ-81]